MMRMSQLFGRTLREAPTGTELTSHKLTLRAGLVRFLGAGLYSYLPLGWRVARKIEAILREVISEVSAESPKDLGKVMKAAMQKIAGRAQGKEVNEIARKLLD